MGVYIRVLKIEQLCCPKCGSRRIVGLQQEYCHCGQCGMPLQIHMPQDQWQRADVLWESPVIREGDMEIAKGEDGSKKETRTTKEPSVEAPLFKMPSEAPAVQPPPGNAPEREATKASETEDGKIPESEAAESEELEFDLEDAGMIFRPDLEEAEWEIEPVYEQLSFFPFSE